jgi:hypothetical protein
MMINRDNYEAFLLDYIEGTISGDDRQELLAFLDKHPDLKADLDISLDISLNPGNHTFNDKEQLHKHNADLYELPVKDYLAIKQCEEGLSAEEQAELILSEPDANRRNELVQLYQNTSLKADQSIQFINKAAVRRSRLIPFFKQYALNRSIAAISILALLASLWLFNSQPDVAQTELAVEKESKTEENKPLTAENKILEKVLPGETPPSKDSLLKLSKNPMEVKQETSSKEKIEKKSEEMQFMASIDFIEIDNNRPINAYEHGLNVMMPQYMNNNLLRQELANIYRQIEEEGETPGLSLAIVEGGVKVMNFLSKESVKMQKYYNSDGKVIGYHLKGDNLEVNHRVK